MNEHAMSLESLLPDAMGALFRIPSEMDPLRNLSVGQIRLLRALLPGKRTATQLGQTLSMSPSALTQMCGRLIAANLVEKQQATDDRRVRELELTELGRELMTTRRNLRAQRAQAVLSRFPAAKAESLIALLREIAALESVHTDLTEVLV